MTILVQNSILYIYSTHQQRWTNRSHWPKAEGWLMTSWSMISAGSAGNVSIEFTTVDVLQAVFISRSICMLLSTYTFGSQLDSPPWLCNLFPQLLETPETKEAYFMPFSNRNNRSKCCLGRMKWIVCNTLRTCSHQHSAIIVIK